MITSTGPTHNKEPLTPPSRTPSPLRTPSPDSTSPQPWQQRVRPSRVGLPGLITYSQIVAQPPNATGTNMTKKKSKPSDIVRSWTTTKPRSRDIGRSHAADDFNLLPSDMKGTSTEPIRFAKSQGLTISLWGAGRIGPSTMVRRIRMHLALDTCDCPESSLVHLTRITQKSGDVRYDATFDSEEHATSALPALVRAGPTTGKWFASRWANYYERHHSPKATEGTDEATKPAKAQPARKRRACVETSAVIVTTLNACSLGVSIAQVTQMLKLHNTSVLALQEVHHKRQREVTPQLLKFLSFPGFRMFYGKHDPEVEGSHGVLLAVRKPLDAWEFGSPTPFHVAILLDSGIDKTLYMSVYIPCTSTPPLRRSRKRALAAVFGTIKMFFKSHPYGKLCVMGDWNMTAENLERTIIKSDLDLKSATLAGDSSGGPTPFTFQQKRRNASGEIILAQSRLDYVLIRPEQDIPNLAIDYTFCGSDHFPLVGTVGTSLEAEFTPPKKTFKVDRAKLSSMSEKQRREVSNYFSVLECDYELDAISDDQSQDPVDAPVVGASADWEPNFVSDPLNSRTTTDKLDRDCDLLFGVARNSMLKVGIGKMSGPFNPDSYRHKVSEKVVSLLRVEKRTRARLRSMEHKYFLRPTSEARRIRVQEAKKSFKIAKESAAKELKDERQSRWRKFVRVGCEHHFQGGPLGTGDPKQHWQFIKQAIGGRAEGAGAGDVLLPDGNIASGDEKVLEAWSQHLERLFSDTTSGSSRGSADFWTTEFKLRQENLTMDPLDGSELPLNWAELCRAAHKMKRGKAPGLSGIPLEFWISYMPSARELKVASTVAGGDTLLLPEGHVNKAIWRIVTQIIAQGHVPSTMTDIISVWLHKKGDNRDPGNYRGIALIESLLKLITTAFATRNNTLMEDRSQFRMEQGGFRRAEETGSQMVALWEICGRRRACGLSTYLFFSDLKKAFDTVGHQALMRKLRAGGMRGDSLRFFTALYRSPSIGARLSCGVTQAMKYLRGVLQGCPASPTCFVTYINDAFATLEKEGGVAVPGMRMVDSDVTDGTLELFFGLLFADDTVTSAGNIAQLQRVLLLVEGWASVWDLSFGIPKCGLMVVSPNSPLDCVSPKGEKWSAEMLELYNSGLELCDSKVPVVSNYEYLGFPFNFDLDLRPGIAARAAAVRKRRVAIRKFLGGASIPVGCRVWALNAMVAPVATYAGELLGMCVTDKDYDLVKPIVAEFNKAVEQVVRGSWTVRDRKRLSFPMGSVRTTVYDQYGIRDIEAVFAQMRARAFAKWPKLKTWISHLVKHPLQAETQYDVHDPAPVPVPVPVSVPVPVRLPVPAPVAAPVPVPVPIPVPVPAAAPVPVPAPAPVPVPPAGSGDTAQHIVHTCKPNKKVTSTLWPNKTVTDVTKLMKWQGDATKRSNALACYVFPPGGITATDTSDIDIKFGTDLPVGGEKEYSNRVFHVAAARLREKEVFKKNAAEGAKLYFIHRKLHLTSSSFRRMSMRNLGYERGYHWLARARCGAFIHTRQAVKAKLIVGLGKHRDCAVCRKPHAEDSIGHFLLRCKLSELESIRSSLPLGEVADAIRRAVTNNNISARRRKPSDEHLVSLLLGGQIPGFSTFTIRAEDIPKPEREIISRAYGNSDWMQHQHPLAAAAMHITAQFLQLAMPHRNASLWRDLTPKMIEYSARSLGRSHSKG